MTPRAVDPREPADEAVSRLLDRIELEEAPADLKQNVLRAIGARPEPAQPGWFESLRAGVRRRLLPPLVPFAAGAVATVLVVALASDGWRGRGGAPLEGVMAPSGLGGGAGDASRAVGARVDDQRFELGRANVRFEVFRPSRRSDGAVVSVTTDAADPVVVTVRLATGAGRIERFLATPSAAGGVEYGQDWVRISRSGDHRVENVEIGLALEAGAGDAPIGITVASGGAAVQGALHAKASPGTDGAKDSAK